MTNTNTFDQTLSMVSLLSASTGLLDVVIINHDTGPRWLLPKNNIIDIFEHGEHNVVLPWRNLELPLYSLVDKSQTPEKVVVCEGASDIHRVGLLIRGELRQHKIRISDIPDAAEVEGAPYQYANIVFNEEVCTVPDIGQLARDLVEFD